MNLPYNDVNSVDVENIIDSKTEISRDNTLVRYYKVQWKSTWETEASLLKFCGSIINEYWKSKPLNGTPINATSSTSSSTSQIGVFGNLTQLNFLTNHNFNTVQIDDRGEKTLSSSFNSCLNDGSASKVVSPLPSLFSSQDLISPLFSSPLASTIKEKEVSLPTTAELPATVNNDDALCAIEVSFEEDVTSNKNLKETTVANTDVFNIPGSMHISANDQDFQVQSQTDTGMGTEDEKKPDAVMGTEDEKLSVVAKVKDCIPIMLDMKKDDISMKTSKEHDYASLLVDCIGHNEETSQNAACIFETNNNDCGKFMETKSTQTSLSLPDSNKRSAVTKRKIQTKKESIKSIPQKKSQIKKSPSTRKGTPRKRTPHKIIKAQSPGEIDKWKNNNCKIISDEDEEEIEIPDEDESDFVSGDWTSSEEEQCLDDSDDDDYDPTRDKAAEVDHEIICSTEKRKLLKPKEEKQKKLKKSKSTRVLKIAKGDLPLTKCPECGKEHCKEVCPRCIKRKTCEVCGHRFVNKCTKCAYTCEQCGKVCWKSYRLKQHIETIHEKIKKYKCDTCGLLFVAKSRLIRHRDVHKATADLICNVCQKAFRHRTTFYRHRKIHSGVKPYKCPVCNRDFQQKEAMKTHLRIHSTGPKRFKCLLCEKDFNHKVSLKEHMQKHHNKDEQQAAVMIGLWKKYQMEESNAVIEAPNPEVLLNRALHAVAMKPMDGSVVSSNIAVAVPPMLPVPSLHTQQREQQQQQQHHQQAHVSLVDFPYLDFSQHEIQMPMSYDHR